MPGSGERRVGTSSMRRILAGAVFAFTLALPAAAQELDICVDRSGATWAVSLSLLHTGTEEILTSLSEGLRAEVSYHIRVYRKARGLFSFLGDRLVEEASPTYEAKWDMFRRQYIIDDGRGNELFFTNSDDFLRSFFVYPRYTIAVPLQEPASYYVLAQSNVRSMKLVPPFTIMSALFPIGTVTTSWTREDLALAQATGK